MSIVESQETQHEVPAGTSNAGKTGIKPLVIGGIAGILGVIALTAVVFALGIYKFGWQGKGTSVVVRAVPYPVALVNNNFIRFAEYQDDLATLHRFYEKQKASGGPAAQFPTDEQMRQNVLNRLVHNEVAAELAVRFNVTVSDDDLDQEFSKLAGALNGGEIEKELLDLYGWTPGEFKVKVIKPFILLRKLDEVVRSDAELNAESRTKADAVLAELKAGEKFEDLAAKNSADTSNADKGGELGWFVKGVMVPEFESAAFALKKGEVGGPVRTKFGYHIIRVDDREEKDGAVIRVNARHILIPALGIERFLENEIAKAKIQKFIAL